MATPLFTVQDDLSDALYQYALAKEMHGKPLLESFRKVERNWIFRTIAAIPKGDREKFIRYMEKPVFESKVGHALPMNNSKAAVSRAAKVNRWKGTLGAWLVFKLNVEGARNKPPEAAYAIVNKWVMRKAAATNLHRAGLLPAAQAVRAPQAGARLPRLKSQPGSFQETATEDVVEFLAENWARAAGPHAVGVVGIAGNAFEAGAVIVTEELRSWTAELMGNTARRHGFDVS